ncbi:MAG TPA: type II toxin-antitoxin system HicA family toxin [Candidatus Nanoarchaeia archaeon]|nr:type II toxin-antitoxin system HicA family toxin [Candidatus Nanoarchaeia archaeon]
MHKLPRVSGQEVVKILSKIGFSVARQKGSHMILTKHTPEGKKAVVVPNHKEVDKGTLLEIIRQAGLKKEDFLKLL